MEKKKKYFQINPPVFYSSALFSLLFVIYGVFAPDQAEVLFGTIQGWITQQVGWFYVLAVAGFLVFVVFIAASRTGRIKLGPEHSEPDYSYASWFAMLFSAGMGIGLMFFGVAEPVMHFVQPPLGEGGTTEAAHEALRITFFHWGIHAWAIYAVVALSLAYFAFRHNLPLTIRSAFYPLIGDRIYGPIGHAADTFAVLGTIFGVATSLGFGVIQINSGLNYLFGIEPSIVVQVLLIIVITAIASVSVGLGLDRGIRRVSELNMILAVALMAFVLVTGPTVFLLQTLVQNTGNYLSSLFYSTFNLYAYEQTTWIGGWTLFYWGWWMAWSPFVGMFIARVSRGRTIREFVVGVLMVPLGFTALWMTIFGDTAIHMIMVQGITGLADAVQADTSVALFQFFEYLPLSMITSLVATLLVVTFFVTSSDSGSLVIDILTSGGKEASPLIQRLFWAAIVGLVAILLLIAGGLEALQTAAIASALPFSVVMVFICWGLGRALQLEARKRVSLSETRVAPMTNTAPGYWRRRLKAIVDHPSRERVMQYISETVRPAFEDVASELQKQGLNARVTEGKDHRIWIEVLHGEEVDFFYQVRPRPYAPPSFVVEDARRPRDDSDSYFRAEVHFKEGGQDYDIMGWTRDEVIGDVLDQYERHLQYLNSIRN
ncbi:MAG: choline BCCT transporter BetT [Opitutales bacterium]|nr:choline BCCT transporter BetT [Opitutales bacterium]